MAEKISTLILKVDLECNLCYKKIRKVLCSLQDKEKIKTISYDEKNNTVTISGPFDPQKLSDKLKCKGGKSIKDIQIKESKEKEKPKDKPKETKPAESAPAEKEKPKPEKQKSVEAAAPVEKEKPKEKATTEEPKKTEPEAKKVEPDPPKVEPVQVAQLGSDVPVWPVGQCCCYQPYYDQGFYGGCRCCTCGRVYGWAGGPPPGFYGGPNCRFFSEEDPSTSCTIM